MRWRRLVLALGSALLVLAPLAAGHSQGPSLFAMCQDHCRDRGSACRRHCRGSGDARCTARCEREERSCHDTCIRVSAENPGLDE